MMKKYIESIKKIVLLTAVFVAVSFASVIAYAATPEGFSSAEIKVNAQVVASCVESQHGAFPNPMTVDTQLMTDQTFPPTADELVSCTNGAVFMVKISSTNGTALNQPCTSGGVSSMLLKSASWPGDTIAYTFMCAGDTNGQGYFTGAGFNSAKALGISIRVAAADAQAAFAHNDYSDTVTLTLSY